VSGPDAGADPVLVGCSHGTRVPAGRAAMGRLRADIAALRPGLEVRASHVDVHKPALDDVVRALAEAGRPLVVVPLLLSTGFHVRVDIARAVESARRLGAFAVAADPLGPDEALAGVLAGRLAESGAGPDDVVVLAAAGSSDPRAGAEVRRVAATLAAVRGTPVSAGYLASAEPTVAEAVAQARREHPGRPVAIASYLLAPGFFAGRLAGAGADTVAAPLAPHPALAALALRRFDAALDPKP
jgi:sirohydrochlorin ferrochelatase